MRRLGTTCTCTYAYKLRVTAHSSSGGQGFETGRAGLQRLVHILSQAVEVVGCEDLALVELQPAVLLQQLIDRAFDVRQVHLRTGGALAATANRGACCGGWVGAH